MRAVAILLAAALAGCVHFDGLSGGAIIVEPAEAHDAALPLDEEQTRGDAPKLARALDAAAASEDGHARASVFSKDVEDVYRVMGAAAKSEGHRDWIGAPVNGTVLWKGEAYTVRVLVA